MREKNSSDDPQKRKHLILYILDIPYFIIYIVLYKVVSYIMFVPLFILLNIVSVRIIFLIY
jgi:hypothetical protein